jgi:hypothetical protein
LQTTGNGVWLGKVTSAKMCPDNQQWLYNVTFTDGTKQTRMKEGKLNKHGKPAKRNTVVPEYSSVPEK